MKKLYESKSELENSSIIIIEDCDYYCKNLLISFEKILNKTLNLFVDINVLISYCKKNNISVEKFQKNNINELLNYFQLGDINALKYALDHLYAKGISEELSKNIKGILINLALVAANFLLIKKMIKSSFNNIENSKYISDINHKLMAVYDNLDKQYDLLYHLIYSFMNQKSFERLIRKENLFIARQYETLSNEDLIKKAESILKNDESNKIEGFMSESAYKKYYSDIEKTLTELSNIFNKKYLESFKAKLLTYNINCLGYLVEKR